MSGSPSTLPGHLDAAPETVAEYQRALEQLPRDALPAILAQMQAGLDHAEATGDLAPLRHLFDSLLVTARLQNNGAYVLAVADADAEDARGERNPEDVDDFVARMRDTYGS